MFAGKKDAGQVGVHNMLPAFQRHLMDQPTYINAGVGKYAVRCTEPLVDKREGIRHLRFVSYVTGQANRSARTLFPRRVSGLFCTFPILIKNGDAVAAPCAKQRGRATNAAATPGNDDKPTL
jgi:hypothetical protein